MASEIVRIGGATLDPGADRLRAADGTETELRRQSAEVLRVLLAHRGETGTTKRKQKCQHRRRTIHRVFLHGKRSAPIVRHALSKLNLRV